MVLHDINKPALSVAHDKSTYFTRTDVGIIPRPLAFPYPCAFLPPHSSYKPFNFDIQCPHPSLEGRGNVVGRCHNNVSAGILERWQKM